MKKLLIVLSVILVIVLVLFHWLLKPNLQVVTGYAAKNLCSCVFVAGFDEAMAKEVDLGFSVIALANKAVNYEEKSATSNFYGLVRRKAIYRPGLGCVLLNEVTEETLSQQSFEPGLEHRDSLKNWFEWTDTTQLLTGAQDRQVAEAIEKFFNENDPQNPKNTRGIVVLYKGRLIGEKYAKGVDKNTPLLGWSMTKSITSTMAGLMIRDGYFKLSDQAPVPDWAGTPKEAITYRDLLQMSSGLEFEENYGGYSDANKMLWISDTTGIATIPQPLIGKPGELWYYSSGTTNLLMHLMRGYFDTHEAYLDYLNRQLFNKIGAYSFLIEPDGAGSFVGSSFGWASARDWARVGQVYLDRGYWNGESVVPESWVQFVQEDAKDAKDVYGGQFWLNNPHPGLPEDTYYMGGFHGQRVIIIPSEDLVVVRLGVTYNASSLDFDGFVNEVIGVLHH